MMSQPTARTRGTLAGAGPSAVPGASAVVWIATILCAALGASIAPHVGPTLGTDRPITAVLLVAALALAVAAQVRLRGYVPAAYWPTMVLAGLVSTVLLDDLVAGHVSAGAATVASAVLLAGSLGSWFAREGTVDARTVTTPVRVAFYWFTVLVATTFGAAAGKWLLADAGRGPGASVLILAGLFALVTAARRFGAGPVVAFWPALVLTRPLGAALDTYLGSSSADGGVGLGALGTGVVFLAAILLTIVYLTASGVDATEHTAVEAR